MGYALLYACHQTKRSNINFPTMGRILRFWYKSIVVSAITTNKYPEDDLKAEKIKARWVSMWEYKIELETRDIS